jgi:aquaporin Z
MDNQDNGRIFAAETVGTAVLILGGPGTAILAGPAVGNTVGIALGFGLSLLIMAYVIGPVSGCHINPAVTLGLFLARKVNGAHAVFAVAGQIVGGIGGAAIVYGIASGRDDFDRGQFAANLWTADHGTRYFGLGSAIVVEVVFTALLVMVVLFTATRTFTRGMGGVVAGLTLTLIHLITIPVDNTSVNPVRSLATALFADQRFDALEQLWAFIVFPLVGAVVGVILFLMLDATRLEDTLLVEVPGLEEIRDRVETGGHAIVESVEDTLDVDDDEQPSTEFPTGNAPD